MITPPERKKVVQSRDIETTLNWSVGGMWPLWKRLVRLWPGPGKPCFLYTVYCTLFTVHCLLYIVYCTLITLHCLLYTVYCTLFTVHCLLYTAYCTLFTVHCTLYTVQGICWLIFVHFALSAVLQYMNPHNSNLHTELWTENRSHLVERGCQVSNGNILHRTLHKYKFPSLHHITMQPLLCLRINRLLPFLNIFLFLAAK